MTTHSQPVSPQLTFDMMFCYETTLVELTVWNRQKANKYKDLVEAGMSNGLDTSTVTLEAGSWGFLVLQQNNHTRVQWRQDNCVKCVVSQATLSIPLRGSLAHETTERGEEGKWALCMDTRCVHIPTLDGFKSLFLSLKNCSNKNKHLFLQGVSRKAILRSHRIWTLRNSSIGSIYVHVRLYIFGNCFAQYSRHILRHLHWNMPSSDCVRSWLDSQLTSVTTTRSPFT